MDRLEAMKTFVRVVERGSFSAVAKELGATQSAVSKQVAALEARLGAKLLVRSTRAIALTRAGEAFFPEARRLAEEVEAAEAKARASERTLEGVLKVAASVGFGAGRLMPVVRSFLAAHPGLAITTPLSISSRKGSMSRYELGNSPRAALWRQSLVRPAGCSSQARTICATPSR